MTVNLILLNRSIRNIVKSGGRKAQSRMFEGYLIRLLVVGAVIAAAVHIPFVNTAGAVIPFFTLSLFCGECIIEERGKD